ncbi:hypothetical protein SNK04_001394 [Fusarium graminearum]
MPPRKSSSRKSDTSTARFVPMDNVSPLEPSPAPASTQVDAPAPASAPISAETIPAEGDAGSSPVQTTEKKDKDKEKEKDKEHKEHITIEDLTLPKSIITRLSKGVLPPNTQIQANAIMALSQSTTVFINYLASHANENTVNAGKRPSPQQMSSRPWRRPSLLSCVSLSKLSLLNSTLSKLRSAHPTAKRSAPKSQMVQTPTCLIRLTLRLTQTQRFLRQAHWQSAPVSSLVMLTPKRMP